MDIPQTYPNKRIGMVRLNSIYWFLDQAVQGVFQGNVKVTTNSIHKPPAGESLKGSTVTARACSIGANLFDAGG
jgi:hypothetical protein